MSTASRDTYFTHTMQFQYEPDHLIEQVKKRPGIWHYEDPDYKIAAKRNKLWMEVVHELLSPDANVTKAELHELVFLLQKKFKGLKDSYHRYINGIKKFSRPYVYSGQLQFLLKNYDPAKLDASLREEKIEEPEPKRGWAKKRMYKLALSGAEAVDADDVADDADEYEVPVTNAIKSIKRSKSSEEHEDNNDQQSDNPKSDSDEDFVPPKITKVTSAVSESFAFANVGVDSSNLEDDPEKMFLLSMLPHLKALPEKTRLQVKLKLMQVLSSAAENK